MKSRQIIPTRSRAKAGRDRIRQVILLFCRISDQIRSDCYPSDLDFSRIMPDSFFYCNPIVSHIVGRRKKFQKKSFLALKISKDTKIENFKIFGNQIKYFQTLKRFYYFRKNACSLGKNRKSLYKFFKNGNSSKFQ